MTSTIKVDTIEEKTSANGVAIDSVTLKDGAVTATAASTITVADNSDNLTLTSTDADANVGPNLRLYRNSGSPADSDILGQIDFEGRNDNSQDYIAAQIKTATGDVSDGTEDAQIEFDVMTGGTLTEYMRMSSGSTPSVVFNEGSADIDFRVESNGNANMIFVDAGNDKVGIGTASPAGKLHIESDAGGVKLLTRGASSSTTTSNDADELFVDNAGNSGITIGSGTSNSGSIHFGDSGDNDIGKIVYDHSGNEMVFTVNTAETLRLGNSMDISTGGETAPDVSDGGICLDQGSDDTNIMTFKSSDVSHGFTGQFDADTYGVIKKTSSSLGGLTIQGMAEDDPGVTIFGIADTSSGTVASNTNAIVHIDARKTTGGSVGGIGSDMLCLFSKVIT